MGPLKMLYHIELFEYYFKNKWLTFDNFSLSIF